MVTPNQAATEFRVQRQYDDQWLDVGTVHLGLGYAQFEAGAWRTNNPDEEFRVVRREVGPWVEIAEDEQANGSDRA
jgi:hypothetical protein